MDKDKKDRFRVIEGNFGEDEFATREFWDFLENEFKTAVGDIPIRAAAITMVFKGGGVGTFIVGRSNIHTLIGALDRTKFHILLDTLRDGEHDDLSDL